MTDQIDGRSSLSALRKAHAVEIEALARSLRVDPDEGLTEDEAASRLQKQGPNRLPERPEPGWVERLSKELLSPMSLLLIAAAVVSGPVLGEFVDAVVIVAIVLINAVIGAVQEGRAAEALAALRSLETATARVLRQGSTARIEAADLVPGDVVVLAAGDRVPADIRLFEAQNLEIDEAILTGESLAVSKQTAVVEERAGVADQVNSAFSGTHVMRGGGRGMVVGTGTATQMGAIASRLDTEPPPTPLQTELRSLTFRLGVAVVIIAAAVFALTLLTDGDAGSLESAFLVAVALAVAAVPEGLPTVVTVGLALGVRRMARLGAIVRRMSAVESLGSASVLLTDKTGTLTENRMAVDRAVTATAETLVPGAPGWERVERGVLVCNDASLEPPEGDPLDIALLEAMSAEARDRLNDGLPRLAIRPFDSERRRMTVVSADDTGTFLAVKGAPEDLLRRCRRYLTVEGRAQTLEGETLAGVENLLEEWAENGVRVIALADRQLDEVPEDVDAFEHELDLVALIGMRDPLRDAARAAVAEARGAGVHVIMVTGDHPGTARAVAEAAGMEAHAVTTGMEMTKNGVPASPLDIPIYARVDPSQKLKLVEALQAKGHVVAVTGDGVNDAPALRTADIGVAMGRRGSDVAKEASDLVVSDDNLATIVSAIREGRGIYTNVRKVVDYLVAGNLSEIIVVVTSLLVAGAGGLALTAIQLLWINLLTDGLPALALGTDAPPPDIMERRPRPRSVRLLGGRHLANLTGRGVVLASGPIAAYALSFGLGDDGTTARTVIFTALVIAHLMYSFAVREPGAAPNRNLFGAVAVGLVLQLALVFVPVLGSIFDLTPIPASRWALVVVSALLPVAAMVVFRRRTAD